MVAGQQRKVVKFHKEDDRATVAIDSRGCPVNFTSALYNNNHDDEKEGREDYEKYRKYHEAARAQVAAEARQTAEASRSKRVVTTVGTSTTTSTTQSHNKNNAIQQHKQRTGRDPSPPTSSSSSWAAAAAAAPPFGFSLGHNSNNTHKRLYGRSREIKALKQAYQGIWDVTIVDEDNNDGGTAVRLRDGTLHRSSSYKSGTTSVVSSHSSNGTKNFSLKPTVQLALISGAAGCGKTTLAMSIQQDVIDDGGFFLAGKFDHHGRKSPQELYGAFVSVFTQFVDAAVAKGPSFVRTIKQRIEDAVLLERRMLLDMIPALERILGPEVKNKDGASNSNVPKEFLQSSDEVACFHYVFKMFVRAISSSEYRIVILLDDLQYADQSSMDLLQSLVTDKDNSGVLFVGTVQVDKKNEQIIQFVKAIETKEITDIRLGSLKPSSVDDMVADILSVVDSTRIKPLTHLVYTQTGGNIFYTKELLRYLQEEKLLTFDENGNEWEWDVRRIIPIVERFRRPIELVTARLSKLSRATYEVLQVASCLGSIVNESILDRISNFKVFSHLQKAVAAGFLRYDTESRSYYFAHDIVQEAAYKMITSQEREAFHLAIGRQLWKSFNKIEELEQHIFLILGQLKEGSTHITDQEERNDVAALCLRAGELAICSSSFQTASDYLQLGVSMLGPRSWSNEYELTLELYNAAAEVEFCIGHMDTSEDLNAAIIANTRQFSDATRAHSIHVYSLGSRGHMLKAIERGLKVLETLGEKFPTKQSVNSVTVAMKRTKWAVGNKSNHDLLRLPLMDKPEKLAAMKIMNIMFLYAYMAVPALAPLIATRMVKLTLDYGLCDTSCVGFVSYGMLLCGNGNDIDEGSRFGEIAMLLFNKFETKAWLGRMVAWFYGSICVWKKPTATIFEPIKKAHRVALELGDVEFAMLNANIYCWESFDISTLSKVEKVVTSFSKRVDAYGQDSVLTMIKPLWQMVQNFKGRAYGDPTVLTGAIMEQDYTIQFARENNRTLFVWCHFYRLLLAYVFGDMEAAERYAAICRISESNPFASSDRVLLTFYDGLVALGQRGKMTRARQKIARQAIKSFKIWSKQCPENFLGKLNFLEAELAAATGDYNRAHSKYASSVSLSREGGYIFQLALVNERAGKYFLQQGNKDLAKGYLHEALASYMQWGGKAKVACLSEELSRLMMK